MPSEKERKAAVPVLYASLCDLGLCRRSELITPAVQRDLERIIEIILSAAEKEREAETCFALTCEKVATHDAPMYGHGRCLYCAEHAEGLPGARPLVREGDIIEKLRGWISEAELHDETGDPFDLGYTQALDELRGFVNDLQEQSTGGEG